MTDARVRAPSGRWELVTLFRTDDRFGDLGPFVPCVDEAGVVAFTALAADGSGAVLRSEGGRCEAATLPAEVQTLISHPDGDGDGRFAVYARLRDGRTALVRAGSEAAVLLAGGDEVEGRRVVSIGPTGPAVGAGSTALRAELDTGPAVLVHDARGVRVRAVDSGIDGVPVVNRAGVLAHRGGGPAIVRDAARLEGFAELGRFPCLAEDGSVGIAARREGEGWTWLRWRQGTDELVPPGAFGFVRGGVLSGRGRLAVYVTPEGGTLTVLAGPRGLEDRLVWLGMELFGGTLVDFALNPVSASERGWIALRLRLDDGRGFIVRTAEPIEAW